LKLTILTHGNSVQICLNPVAGGDARVYLNTDRQL
jgi:hypothetical protein